MESCGRSSGADASRRSSTWRCRARLCSSTKATLPRASTPPGSRTSAPRRVCGYIPSRLPACACLCLCVRACVRRRRPLHACVRACVRACVCECYSPPLDRPCRSLPAGRSSFQRYRLYSANRRRPWRSQVVTSASELAAAFGACARGLYYVKDPHMQRGQAPPSLLRHGTGPVWWGNGGLLFRAQGVRIVDAADTAAVAEVCASIRTGKMYVLQVPPLYTEHARTHTHTHARTHTNARTHTRTHARTHARTQRTNTRAQTQCDAGRGTALARFYTHNSKYSTRGSERVQAGMHAHAHAHVRTHTHPCAAGAASQPSPPRWAQVRPSRPRPCRRHICAGGRHGESRRRRGGGSARGVRVRRVRSHEVRQAVRSGRRICPRADHVHVGERRRHRRRRRRRMLWLGR